MENRGANTTRWWDAVPREEWTEFERIDDGAGWFEVYRMAPDVLAIYEPGQFEEVISYLILGTERALLFDTGAWHWRHPIRADIAYDAAGSRAEFPQPL